MARLSIKIKYPEMEKVSDNIAGAAHEISKSLKRMKEVIAKIPLAWEGEDATEYCNEFMNFLEKLSVIPTTLNEFNVALDKQLNRYHKRHEDFENKVRGVNIYDDIEI